MPGYLDQYGAGEEKRNKTIIRAIVAVVTLTLAIALGWYIFKNRHQEGVVKDFVAAVRRGDLQGAYRIWGCTDRKPCSGYEYEKFLRDWNPKSGSPDAPDLSLLGLTDSQSCNNGVLLTLAVNGTRSEVLWVDKSADAISYSPYPICPHRNPWAIMLHRTVGRLRKPLLK